MSDPVLSQLVVVEADLAQQVETLSTQLAQLRTQQEGLRTVIDMFQDSDDADIVAEIAAAAVISKPQPEETAGRADEPAAKSTGQKSAVKKTAAKKTAAKKTTRKTATKAKPAKPGRKAAKKVGGRKKRDGRAANWQKYVQSDYRDVALPESVSSVLRSHPSEIFTIADVMSSIFSEDMPRASYLKARNRISNILSAGARDGTWYRGRNGRYSQSESVTKVK